jgi:RNA polymerase sigma-70 factor (ECF subfamily)
MGLAVGILTDSAPEWRPVTGHRGSGVAVADVDLVGRARAGDQAAFTALFEQYHAQILNYVNRMVNDRALAEDLTQDTFVKAWNALGGTRDDLAFKPWLYRIATNTAISHLRRRKLVQWIPFVGGDEDLHPSSESVEGTVTRSLDIDQAMKKLPKHYVSVLLLRHYQGLSLAETASALDITENAAKLRLFRARKAFAEVYDVEPLDPSQPGNGGNR